MVSLTLTNCTKNDKKNSHTAQATINVRFNVNVCRFYAYVGCEHHKIVKRYCQLLQHAASTHYIATTTLKSCWYVCNRYPPPSSVRASEVLRSSAKSVWLLCCSRSLVMIWASCTSLYQRRATSL